MSEKLDELFKTYAYDSRQKVQLRIADEKHLDISKMKDPRYNWEQMLEILLAMEYGNEIHFIDYVKRHNKNQKLTIPLNQAIDKIQDYNFTYTVSNGVKSTSKQLIVKVVDTTKPVLELAQNEITIKEGEPFVPKNFIKTAKDNYDSLTFDDVTINNNVDTNKAGDYEVDYSLKDQHGNVAGSKMKVLNGTLFNSNLYNFSQIK